MAAPMHLRETASSSLTAVGLRKRRDAGVSRKLHELALEPHPFAVQSETDDVDIDYVIRLK